MEYGDPDGHGLYGQLTEGETGLVCHECGVERQFLGRHVRVHGLTAAQYRARHGLGRSTPLASTDLRGKFSEHGIARVGSAGWARFEEARNIDAARAESVRVHKEEELPAQTRQLRTEIALAASRSRPARFCEVPDCGRKHVADGLCRTHYERRKRSGSVQADIPVRPRKGGPRTGG